MAPRASASQYGAPSPVNGDDVDPACVGHALGEGFGLRGRFDQPELIAQPLHERARHEHTCPRERTRRPPPRVPTRRWW